MADSSPDEVLNIKKRSASDIFYGEDAVTGQMIHISDAKRGLKCGCVCAHCKRPLIARKGDIRIPHFAHQSNYDCFYSNEVAVYKVVAEILAESRRIMVPKTTLDFPAWPYDELLQGRRILPLDNDAAPEYHCEETQYPPDLFVTIGQRQLRIILDFGGYYDEHDISELREQEKALNHGCIRYRFPEFGLIILMHHIDKK